jgi:hypothetical protein
MDQPAEVASPTPSLIESEESCQIHSSFIHSVGFDCSNEDLSCCVPLSSASFEQPPSLTMNNTGTLFAMDPLTPLSALELTVSSDISTILPEVIIDPYRYSSKDDRRDPIEVRREKDRVRKRNLSEEQKAKIKEKAIQRKDAMTEEEKNRMRAKDRERKRLKSLDTQYRLELSKRTKMRKAAFTLETVEKIRERDRKRKRKEYKVSTAGAGMYVDSQLQLRSSIGIVDGLYRMNCLSNASYTHGASDFSVFASTMNCSFNIVANNSIEIRPLPLSFLSTPLTPQSFSSNSTSSGDLFLKN